MLIFYDKNDGSIKYCVDDNQSKDVFFKKSSKEKRESIGGLFIEGDSLIVLENYKVIDNKLVCRSNEEISEIQIYGKVLTEEERQLNKLKPTQDEVKKAENTIEILSIIQEVI